MKVQKAKKDMHCSDCEKHGQGYRISYSDGVTLTYICKDCLDSLTKRLNEISAENWLENEMG